MSTKITRKCGRPKKSASTTSAAEPAEILDKKTASIRQKSTASKKAEPVTPAVKQTKRPVTPTKSALGLQQPEQQHKPLSRTSPPIKDFPPPTAQSPAPSKILQEVFQKHASPRPTVSTPRYPPTQISALSSTPPPPSPAVPEVSPLALNAFAVSQLSRRSGRRPPTNDDGKLPEKYKPAARKITYALVALPIAIVTSWVLYQRLILGQKRKRLVPDSDGE